MQFDISRGNYFNEKGKKEPSFNATAPTEEEFFQYFPNNYCMVITGFPGTYKSSISYYIATHCGLNRDMMKYILIEENNKNFLSQMDSLSIRNNTFDSIINCVPFIDPSSNIAIRELFSNPLPSAEFCNKTADIIQSLFSLDKDVEKLVIIDSISTLIDYCQWDLKKARQIIGTLVNILRAKNINSIFISERMSKEIFLNYLADIVLEIDDMSVDTTQGKDKFIRCIKFRGKKYNPRDYRIYWRSNHLFLI